VREVTPMDAACQTMFYARRRGGYEGAIEDSRCGNERG